MEELEDDPDAYLEIDVDFHSEIASATGNVVLAFVLDSVRELLRVSRRVTNLINAMPETTVAHRRIYEALVAREPETARQAMRAHLLTVTEVWTQTSSRDAMPSRRRIYLGGGRSMSSDAAAPPHRGGAGRPRCRRHRTQGGSDRLLGQHGPGGHAHRAGPERPARPHLHRQLRGRDGADRLPARRHHLPRRRDRPDPARQAVHRARAATSSTSAARSARASAGSRRGSTSSTTRSRSASSARSRARSSHDTLKAQYGWNIPWWVCLRVLVVCVTAFTLFGIALSVKVDARARRRSRSASSSR